MSIAQDVAEACRGAQAYTLTGGYAVHEDRRVTFPPCKVVERRQNERGRVTHLLGAYQDGSHLTFSWHSQRGSKLA